MKSRNTQPCPHHNRKTEAKGPDFGPPPAAPGVTQRRPPTPPPATQPWSPRQIGLSTSITLIVTNMVGTGVFTSLGFQLEGLNSPFAILLLWVCGGVIALCGAAVYAELALVFPGSGGEYNFLSRLYHPLAGFLAGWLSATVGFAAPIALAALAFGAYAAKVLPGLPPTWAACSSIALLALVHSRGVKAGAFAQHLLTLSTLALILFIIGSGFTCPEPQVLNWSPSPQVFSAAFAVSLVYVSYAFSGWNAATYLTGEIRNPRVNLPASLLLGTALVTLLYVALNLTFLRTTPAGELRGVLEVGHVAATHIFGAQGARVMSLVLTVSLLGAVSGMIFTSSRIPPAIAEEYRVFAFLRWRNAAGAPVGAVAMQSGIALLLAFTGAFQAVLSFVGFTLSLCTCLCVAGIFVVRARGLATRAYRCWGYPFSPLLFLALNLWMLAFIFWHNPLASSLGLLLISTGIPVYFWLQRRQAAVADEGAARRKRAPLPTSFAAPGERVAP